VAKRTGCNSQHETKTPTADLAHFWERRNQSPGRKLEDKTTIRRRGKGKEVHHHESKERKGRGRDVAMALVLRLLHAREGASLLSFLFFSPRAPAKHAWRSSATFHQLLAATLPSRPVPFRPTPLVRRYIPQSRIGLATYSNTSFRGGEVP
jgi:hypothetical protein